MRLMAQLEVLHQWTRMFKALIERFESKNYAHFNVLMRSEDLARVFIELLALTANQGSARYHNSLISFSGLQKLDQILNQTKTNVLEAYNMVIEYALQMNENVQMTSPIVTKCIAIAPNLIISARTIATDPDLESYLEDETYSEMVV